MSDSLKVLVCTAKEQQAWLEALSGCLPEARVYAGLDSPECDYAVIWKPPPELFRQQSHLKALFSLGAGVDGLLAMPSLPRDVPLVRMEDVGMAAQMEEYVLHAALRQFRQIPHYEDAQAQRKWLPKAMRARADFCVGVLGLGVLGGAVARALADFGFSVSGWSRSPRSLPGVRCEYGPEGLDAVLANSQVLLLLLPLTPETAGLMGAENLAKLPRGAVLLNLSRGALVDDDALLQALDCGRIGEAWLDVFQHEPLPSEHPYWSHAGVHITPHIAALTPHELACDQVARKIRQLEKGEAIAGLVDRQLGY